MSIKSVWHRIKAVPFIGDMYEKYIGSKKVAHIEKKCREELVKDGEKYMGLVEDTLKDSGAIYYAYAGTLLGLIRDGKFINWDFDIDYAIVITQDFTWNDLENLMRKSGFKKTREFVFDGSVKEQSYAVGKLNIDFFGQFYEDTHMIQYSFEYIPDCKYNNENERSVYLVTLPKVVETKKIRMENVDVSVPVNSEEILAAIYNEDWRVPNPNWKSNIGKCSVLLKNKVAYQVVL